MDEVNAPQSAAHRIDILSSLNIARFQFTLIAESSILLPAYKGSTFHGGFGHALKHVSPTFYDFFYKPPGNGAPPKAFVISPPLEHKNEYSPGESLCFELVLFGAATQHFPICFSAIEALGSQLGFGHNKGQYRIEKVDYFDAASAPQWLYQQGQWRFVHNIINGQQIATASADKNTTTITLQLKTRLRLKDQNHLVRSAPNFQLLLDRLLGRLCTLSRFYQNTELLQRPERQALLKLANEIKTSHSTAHWDDWQRYSGRQKEWMKFGGLLGDISYEGDLAPFMPYLRLGEWVHVGGKTSFGLGKYTLATQ